MKSILSFFLLFFCIGCNNQSKNKNIIAPDKGKYWDVAKNRSRTYNSPSYCYYFGSNGDCFYYYYDNYYKSKYGKIKRSRFDYGHVVYLNTWRLKSDTLEIQGFDYLIKAINDTSISLLSTSVPPDTLILKASTIDL